MRQCCICNSTVIPTLVDIAGEQFYYKCHDCPRESCLRDSEAAARLSWELEEIVWSFNDSGNAIYC